MVRRRKRSYAAKHLNEVIGTRVWCHKISSLEGKTTKPPAENHLINGEWMTKPEMVEALHKYFASVDGVRAGEQSVVM